jgi:hypothetical protein
MRILILALMATLTVPAAAVAQQRGRGHSSDSGTPAGTPPRSAVATAPRPVVPAPSRHAVPRWTISPRSGPVSEGWPRSTVPNWSITPRHGRSSDGVPLPPIGLQPHIRSYKPGLHHSYKPQRHYHSGIYSPWYGWPVVYVATQPVESYAEAVEAPPVVEQPSEVGRLALDVQPAPAQVFADGYYVGTAEDFTANTGGLVLETGPHRVDLVMPDHEQVTFDVRIAPNQFLTYRQVLRPINVQPVQPPAVRSAPATFYLIPGCYMGNVPPKEANLRPTCDPAHVITFQQ